MAKSLFNTAAYKELVKDVSKEFADLEDFLKRRTAQGLWRVGRYIEHHLLEHKDRGDYGKTVIINLAKDVGRDPSLLNRALKFYRTYPILAAPPELSWEHYRSLITVKDEGERKRLEQKAISKDWNTRKLRDYLNTKRELAAPDDGKPLDSARGKPIPQLKFTRGRLKEGDIVVKGKGRSFAKCTEPVKADELFTYVAKVDKVIDGDTLLVAFGFGLSHSVSQKLRLRGIDCPEMDTEEGKKAKRFVESRLKGCEFIIVKTYKDRTDNWDRYVADVFYQIGTSDPGLVAREGIYLNQELLDNHLAVIWK